MSGNLPAKPSAHPALEQANGAPPTGWQGWTAQQQPPEEGGIPWERYTAAIRRYKWLIVALAVLGTSIGLLLTRFYTPLYTVTGAVWVSPDASQARAGGAIVATDPLSTGTAWADLLTSRAVFDHVVRKRRLYLRPDSQSDSVFFSAFEPGPNMAGGRFTLEVDPTGREYSLLNAEEEVVERGLVGDSIGRTLDWRWAPEPALLQAGQRVPFSVQSPTAAAYSLSSRISVTPPSRDRGQTLRLSLTSGDPVDAAVTMNTLLRELVAVAEDLKKRTYVEVMRTIEGQLEEAARDLRQKEQAYQGFRTRTITLPTEGTTIAGGVDETTNTVLSGYFEQKMMQADARRDREQLERLLRRAEQGDFSVDAFLLIPAVQTNASELRAMLQQLATKEAELRTLLVTFTEEVPQVQHLQREINTMRRQAIPATARQTIALLRQREQDLGQQVAAGSRELQAIPARTIEGMQRAREVAVAEGLYTQLQGSFQTARLAELSAKAEISILDTAVAPLFPSNANTTPRLLLMAIVAGLAGGIGLALLLDHVDPRLRYPAQVSGDLGLPILGVVPTLPKNSQGAPDPEEASQAIEAFRSIRLSITHYFQGGPIALTVTSPGAGDGKSLVAANLALSYAEAGYRTLLIDGDTRRGKLHDVFGLDRRPGLVDYLTGDARLEVVLRASGQDNLWVIPCGTRRHRAPELLMSEAQSTLLSSMRERFDVIIVDSPPLGAGSDPYVLATATGHMLFVLRTGTSDRKLAEAKLRMVDRLPINIVGAVMNDVRATGVYRYYSYLYGYSALDEDAEQISSRVGALPAGR